MRIDSTSADNRETNLRIYGVSGQYAHISRGCEGEIYNKEIIPFNELGASIDHKLSSNHRIGLHVSIVRSKEIVHESYEQEYLQVIKHFAVNPFFNIEFDNFAFGLGYFVMGAQSSFSSFYVHDAFNMGNGITAYLRLGNPNTIYIDGSAFQKAPLLSRGPLSVGIGSDAIPFIGWWFGIGSIVPYDAFGFLSNINIKLHPKLSLDFFVRLGTSEGIQESAIGVGLSYKFHGHK